MKSQTSRVHCCSCEASLLLPSLQNLPLGNLRFFELQKSQVQLLSSKETIKAVEKNSALRDYYEILNVPREADHDQIKKAYYKLAMRHHPDKYQGPNVEENEEQFKEISEAYQVLSDPQLRDRYNRYGRESNSAVPEGGFMQPEQFFKQTFGGDQFVDVIGEISIARDFGDALAQMDQQQQPANDATQATMTPEERERIRHERVEKLSQNLLHKLAFYTEHSAILNPAATAEEKRQVEEEFVRKLNEEVNDLKMASYGVPLLHAIGYMYSLKAKQWLGKDETFLGLGKFFHDVREKGHFISETVGTIKAAVELQAALSRLQESEQAAATQQEGESENTAGSASTSTGNISSQKKDAKQKKPMTAEEKAYWEEQAATKGLDTLWKGSKMEVETVIRDVCDRVLSPGTEKSTLKRRAAALKIIGRVYEAASEEASQSHPAGGSWFGGR